LKNFACKCRSRPKNIIFFVPSNFFIDDYYTLASLDSLGTFGRHDGVGVLLGSNPVPQKLQNGWLGDGLLPLKLCFDGGHRLQPDDTYSKGSNTLGDNQDNLGPYGFVNIGGQSNFDDFLKQVYLVCHVIQVSNLRPQNCCGDWMIEIDLIVVQVYQVHSNWVPVKLNFVYWIYWYSQ